MRDFGVRRSRQVLAVSVSLSLVLFLAVIYKYPPVLVAFSSKTIFGAQVMIIAAFIGFSRANWRCPSCDKYLGNDIGRRICGKCGSRLR